MWTALIGTDRYARKRGWREIAKSCLPVNMDCEGAKPKWAIDHGLQLCGQYYEGFVNNYEAVLSHHKMETVTSYGSRQNASSSTTPEHHSDEKENEVQDTKDTKDKV